MESLCKELASGILTMPLAKCELRQRGSQEPILYSGPGLVTQDADGRLRLRVFAQSVDTTEAVKRDVGTWQLIPGRLVPDTEYYDFTGKDQWGNIWSATHLSLDTEFGTTTFIQSTPRIFEKRESGVRPAQMPMVAAFLPELVELPWHEITKYGEVAFKTDRFEHDGSAFKWTVRKIDQGTWIHFQSTLPGVEDHFLTFMRGLSILTGRALQPLVLSISEDGIKTTRINDRSAELNSASLLTPISLVQPEAREAHSFLTSFLGQVITGKSDQIKKIHRFWHRVLRARENDIENCSLVLSVAIEGVLKEVLLSADDVDREFIAEIEHARPILRKAGLKQRALSCVLSSLGNAVKPRPQSALKRLEADGAITELHIEAWKQMRHVAAHGDLVEFTGHAFQQHIDRYHLCLDLFYRILFVVIGYSGKHTDYSCIGWPSRPFQLTR